MQLQHLRLGEQVRANTKSSAHQTIPTNVGPANRSVDPDSESAQPVSLAVSSFPLTFRQSNMTSRRDSHSSSLRSQSPIRRHRDAARHDSRKNAHGRSYDGDDGHRGRETRDEGQHDRHSHRRHESREDKKYRDREPRRDGKRARKEETPLSDSDLLNLEELGVQPITDDDYLYVLYDALLPMLPLTGPVSSRANSRRG